MTPKFFRAMEPEPPGPDDFWRKIQRNSAEMVDGARDENTEKPVPTQTPDGLSLNAQLYHHLRRREDPVPNHTTRPTTPPANRPFFELLEYFGKTNEIGSGLSAGCGLAVMRTRHRC